jgi:hypothetical protein
MPIQVAARARKILRTLLMTALSSDRKNTAIEIGAVQSRLPMQTASPTAASNLLSDPVLVDFLTSRHDTMNLRLPRMVARLLSSGGLLRNIISRSQLDELETTAQLVRSMAQDLHVRNAQVTLKPSPLGPDFRNVSAFSDGYDAPFAPTDDYYLYLPVGKGPARLIDYSVASIFMKRRQTARIFSIINVVLLLLSAVVYFPAILYFGNNGIAFLMVTAWVVGPFAILHFVIVRPVLKRFLLFPGFTPTSEPTSECSLFEFAERLGTQ